MYQVIDTYYRMTMGTFKTERAARAFVARLAAKGNNVTALTVVSS